MRIALKITHILVGALLVVSTAFQLLAMLGGVVFNANNNLSTEFPWLVPVWCGMLALLIAAFVLVIKKGEQRPWQPIILVGALIGAIAALAVAFTLRDAFPDSLNVNGETQGLTTWKLLYRHVSSALIGVIIAVEATVQWILSARARRKAEADAANSDQSTIGLDFFAGDASAAMPKKLKRSLRRAKQKAETSDTVQ